MRRKTATLSQMVEHTWTIFLHDMADDGGLYAVDNVVTLAGNQVAIADNMYIILDKVSA